MNTLILCLLLPAQDPLPGTAPLRTDKDLASEMVAGIHRFLLGEIEASVGRRKSFWEGESVEPNRQRLKKYIGAVDVRVEFDGLEFVSTTKQPSLVGRGKGYEIHAVRWPVFRGVQGEGLLLTPTGRKPTANVVAIPDADWTPEMICGLKPGFAFAQGLAESGCRVVIPTLIDRADTWSVSRVGRGTNQPHREFVYRPAFEMGRHIIGYEVQKVLAVVDWFVRDADGNDPDIQVIGYGEGGLLAFYAGAIDTRIDRTLVGGYLESRQNVWKEPIYRNVFGLLREFGDAGIARLIRPRALNAFYGPRITIEGPPKPRRGRGGAAPGRWTTPSVEAGEKIAIGVQVRSIGMRPIVDLRKDFDPRKRLKQQLEQLLEDTQHLMRESSKVRKTFWSKAMRDSVENWVKTSTDYRSYFYDEVIGRFDRSLLPAKPRTRKVFDEPAYVGYEVQLDVFPDVFAYGTLLVPKSIKEGERRPVVVCQHGLEGRPRDLADPKVNHKAYNQYGCRLAERGFVVYAPQNPYVFRDRFRTLQRMLNPLKKTLFSIIVPQHQQTVDWLASLPFVDSDRIAFYGLSYGGKTAMRVPPLVDRYCLSICSADFNEWIWKNASLDARYSYVTTGEYEIFEFDLGNTFNYAEMAGLIAPRPFMVERGHYDGVAPDEWVAYEYGKVRRLYADLKIPDRTQIEYFAGPHTINGVGTFRFLHKHLNWPEPR